MDVIRGSTNRPVSTDRFVDAMNKSFPDMEAVLYIGYPVLPSAEDTISLDALLISRQHGIIAFNFVEGRDAGNYKDEQDELASLLESKFMRHKVLRCGRELLSKVEALTYAPLLPETEKEGYSMVGDGGLAKAIKKHEWDNKELYEIVVSIVQSITGIRRGRSRVNERSDSHGAALKRLEDSIANLDAKQNRAVIETVDGVQRIRGLAGSGKTIVLALKAAYLHIQHPDWKIAVTFNTRSLKDQFVRLIENFVLEQTNELPNENIFVINAWGGAGGRDRIGMYYHFCVENGATYYNFQQAVHKFNYKNAFSKVVSLALSEVEKPKPLFDAILVDEAQDFDPDFLKLCYRSLGSEKRLVYAYDELQSLTDSSLPSPEDIFGKNPSGQPVVTFDGSSSSQDISLRKCYRNSRPVLTTAHALGFGIYREPDANSGTGLIQMFDRADLWTETGYKVIDGDLDDGRRVTLARTVDSSPEFLEKEPAEIDELISFRKFQDSTKQAKWVASRIKKNLEKDELRPEDIVVINPSPSNANRFVGPIRQILFDAGIPNHLVGVDSDKDYFFNEGSVAFTGIHRAKGNEAGMVYIINAQNCYGSLGELGRLRNCLFTAITRSKAWVRVLGYGPEMSALEKEYQAVLENDYSLSFVYPDKNLREKLRVINRDMSSHERSQLKSTRKTISDLVKQFKNGDINIDDLPEEEINNLKLILDRRA